MLLAIAWILVLLTIIGLIAGRGDMLALLNFVILQWSFFRYVRIEDVETLKFKRMGWEGPVIPLTGWWTRSIPEYPAIIKTRQEKEEEARNRKESPIVQRKRKPGH